MIDIRNSRCQSSNKSDVLCGKMGQLICWQIDVLSWLVFFLITLKLVLLVCFFFSSRRRHTRYIGDWSSDVCSSDLKAGPRSPDPAPFGTRGVEGPMQPDQAPVKAQAAPQGDS